MNTHYRLNIWNQNQQTLARAHIAVYDYAPLMEICIGTLGPRKEIGSIKLGLAHTHTQATERLELLLRVQF